MRYLIYARKSTESEDRQVQSLDDQLRAMRETAQRYGLVTIDELMEARSAKAPCQRPVFADMLKRIKHREADGILCWSINRLFRNSVDYGEVAWLLQEGVIRSIRTVDREYLPEDNVLLIAVEAGVATQYIIDLRKAVKRGLTSKAEKGWFPGVAPPGYANNKLTHEIEIDGPRFELFRKAWELMLTGCYTVPQVREKLTEWGFGKIARSTLYRLFANPFYTGRFRYRGELHIGNHPPMVTTAEFDRIQAVLQRPGHIQPQKQIFSFTGLIRCGVCGCLVTAERKVKESPTTGATHVYVYYHCSGAKGCSKSGIREERLEAAILDWLKACSIDKEVATVLQEMVDRHHAELPASHLSLVEQQKRALTAAKLKLDRLLELRLNGELEADEFRVHKLEAQEAVAKLEGALQETNARQSRDHDTLKNCLAFAATAHEDFASGSVETKRQIATALSDRYVLTRGDLELQAHPLVERIRTFEPPKSPSNMVREGVSVPPSLIGRGWLDNIRTFIRENDITFRYSRPEQYLCQKELHGKNGSCSDARGQAA